jgi:asparagine synthase (glutamine-hydrolysing)
LLALGAKPRARQMALLLSPEGPHFPPSQILAPDVRKYVDAQNPFERYERVSSIISARSAAQSMLHTDLQILLPDIFLEKVDRATMAHGLEVRVPFLDNDLVNFVGALPAELKVSFGQKKRLLRSAMRGVVPDFVLDARKKGFGVPTSSWLRGPLREFFCDSVSSATAEAYIDRRQAVNMLDAHARGDRDHGALLWNTLQFALWLRMSSATRRAPPKTLGEH